MATSVALGLYLPDGSDYVSVDRDLNQNYQKIDDAFGNLFLLKMYTASSVSASSGSGKSLKASDFTGIEEIEGYTPLAVFHIFISNASVVTRYFCVDNLLKTGDSDYIMAVRNTGSSAVSGVSIELGVIWVKTAFINDQTSA